MGSVIAAAFILILIVFIALYICIDFCHGRITFVLHKKIIDTGLGIVYYTFTGSIVYLYGLFPLPLYEGSPHPFEGQVFIAMGVA